MAKTKPNKRKKVITAHDIAASAGIRIHENGDIELLDEREATTIISNMFREVMAKAFSRDRPHGKVH